MMAIVRGYSYRMGFQIDGSPIPDPSVFTGAASALDTSGGRDATGTLHRAMVATKHPLKLEYHSITFDMMESIMSKMRGDSFQFTYPDPLEGCITIRAYVGDREWETQAAQSQALVYSSTWKSSWLGNLSFSVIEY